MMGWVFELGADFYGFITAQPAWRKSCAELVARLPAGDRLRIVDLGCGPGVSAFELARQRPADSVCGLDLSRRMLAEAQRRSRRSGLSPGRVGWIRADATKLPFPRASVDALTGHSFLYLLPDRRAALAECQRVLKPNGRLILMEPNDGPANLRELWGISRDPRFLLSMTLWRPASRLNGRFTQAALHDTLTRAGFSDCRVDRTLAGLGLLAVAVRPGPA